MKKILAVVTASVICVCATKATIAGLVTYLPSASYVVPSGNILVIESVSFSPATAANDLYIDINNGNLAPVYFNNVITNGFYTLPKPILVPGGATVSGFATIMGALINSSDAPLFVGVGSTITNLVATTTTLTGTLQLSKTAIGSRVLFQSSPDLFDWNFDTSVMVLPGANDTQWQFTVPVGNSQRFYRALVRRQYGG